MLRDVFSFLCAGAVPIGPHIWEMTRICLSPSLARESARWSLGLVWLGAVEFCIDHGICTMTGLTHAPMFANIAAAGIDIEPLGPITEFDGVQYAALQTHVDKTVLARERARLGERDRVLTYQSLCLAAA